MKTKKQPIGRILGILFLIPLVTYGLGSGILATVFDSPNYLIDTAQNKLWVTAGAMLVLGNCITVVAVGVILYPILAGLDKRIALAYLSARF